MLKNPVWTLEQINEIYKVSSDLIENLDEHAIGEIFSGDEKGINNITDIIVEESAKALYSNNGSLQSSTFGYLDKLTLNLDNTLKSAVFNYFVLTCLPEFEVNWHHIEWGNLVQLYKNLCIIAARDHSKSFTFSKAYPLWKLYRYKRGGTKLGLANLDRELVMSKKGMIITSEFTLGTKLMDMIIEEIHDNSLLREALYPKGKTEREKWGSTEIRCRNGAELLMKSIDSRLRGYHPHWIVVDDILTDSQLYSFEQREKSKNIFHSVITNMIVPGGSTIVIGTPFHQNDLYPDLKGKQDWKVFEYPAIFPDGSLLWKRRYSLESLLKKRETQGSIIFSREILCRPVSSESTIFPYHILEKSFISMGDFSLVRNVYSHPKKFLKISIGCDFAISSEIGADYTVYTVWGLDDLDNYWLLWIWREKGAHYTKQIGVLKELNTSFSPSVIMAEDNAFQKVMIELAKEAGLPIIPHTTGVNKFDLKSGLPGLAVLFEQQKIRLPRGDQYSKDLTDTLVGELSSITWTEKGRLESVSEHDDTAMSSWLGIKGLVYVNSSFSFDFI